MPSLRTYAIRRAARILPGYWLALTVSFILSFTLLGVPFDSTLLFRYVSGFALVASFHWLTWFPVEFNGPLWSIGCEITSYAVLPLGLMLVFMLPKGMLRTWGGRVVWLAVIVAVVYAQTLAVKYLQPDSYQRDWRYGMVGGAKVWMPNYSPIAFFAIFAVGTLAAGVQVWVASLRSIVFDLLALAGAALAVWSMAQHYPGTDGYGLANIPYGFPWFPLGVGLMLVSIPSSVLLKQVTEAAPIAFVARISFGIYVWHFMIMEMIRVLYQPRYVYAGMSSVSEWAWISVGVIAVSVALATVSYYWFEAPIIRWARGLERRPDASLATPLPAAG
jgi:peptidoglycan/LPS O-acetylase OafA/YrhL